MGRFLELVRSRRSIRRYKPDPIDPAVLTRILEAGSLAPSGNNTQPWRFIVVRDREMKERLCDVSGKQPWILEAPVTIAVVGDILSKIKTPPSVGAEPSIDDPMQGLILLKTVRDATIAADHIVMAAEDEGLGSCWIAMFEQADIAPVLGVPPSCYVVALITLGIPAERPAPRPRHALRELVFREKYGRHFDESEPFCS